MSHRAADNLTRTHDFRIGPLGQRALPIALHPGLSFGAIGLSCLLVKAKLILPIVLMLLFALSRWPGLMPWNFSAAYALMFCAGVYFPKKLVWWLPVVTMLASDLALNLYYHSQYNGSPIFSPEMIGNYLGYFVLLWLGRRFSAKAPLWKLIGGGLIGAIFFYLISNTFSWFCNPFHNPEYTKTLWGWLTALTRGTTHYVFPIRMETWEMFRNTMISGGLFTGLFAGSMKVAEAAEEQEEKEEKPAEAEGEKQPQPEEAKA